jgi:hypothetical protein
LQRGNNISIETLRGKCVRVKEIKDVTFGLCRTRIHLPGPAPLRAYFNTNSSAPGNLNGFVGAITIAYNDFAYITNGALSNGVYQDRQGRCFIECGNNDTDHAAAGSDFLGREIKSFCRMVEISFVRRIAKWLVGGTAAAT